MPAVPSRPAPSPRPSRLVLCHLAEAPAGAEEADLVAALRGLGHTVLAVVAAEPKPGPDPAGSLAASGEPLLLAAVETLPALAAAAGNPAGLAAATRFAQRQQDLPRRALLRAAARLAAVARGAGCRHIHAAHPRAGAAIAICAARIAGITASFAVRGPEAPGTADLALKLAAADLVVAQGEPTAAAVRRLAPHARILALPRAGGAARLAEAFAAL